MEKVWWNPRTWSPEERRFALSAVVCVAAVTVEVLEKCPSDKVKEKIQDFKGTIESVKTARTLLG